jgi:hypothetical protein
MSPKRKHPKDAQNEGRGMALMILSGLHLPSGT